MTLFLFTVRASKNYGVRAKKQYLVPHVILVAAAIGKHLLEDQRDGRAVRSHITAVCVVVEASSFSSSMHPLALPSAVRYDTSRPTV